MLEDQDMSAQEAAAVVQDARARARKELVISAPLVYAAWGLVWLLGYGAMWLSVRGQHPYAGPSGVSIAAVFVLAGFAVAILIIANKAAAGIDGRSARPPRHREHGGDRIPDLAHRRARGQQLRQYPDARVHQLRGSRAARRAGLYPCRCPRTIPVHARSP